MARPRLSREEAIANFLERIRYEGLIAELPADPSPLDRFRFFFGPCWRYEGAKSRGGYGALTFEGRQVSAHRFAWRVLEGRDLAEGYQLDHVCRVRDCVNPAHLEPVTAGQNMLRMERSNYDHDRQECRFGHSVPWPLFRRMGCASCRAYWKDSVRTRAVRPSLTSSGERSSQLQATAKAAQ